MELKISLATLSIMQHFGKPKIISNIKFTEQILRTNNIFKRQTRRSNKYIIDFLEEE